MKIKFHKKVLTYPIFHDIINYKLGKEATKDIGNKIMNGFRTRKGCDIVLWIVILITLYLLCKNWNFVRKMNKLMRVVRITGIARGHFVSDSWRTVQLLDTYFFFGFWCVLLVHTFVFHICDNQYRISSSSPL